LDGQAVTLLVVTVMRRRNRQRGKLRMRVDIGLAYHERTNANSLPSRKRIANCTGRGHPARAREPATSVSATTSNRHRAVTPAAATTGARPRLEGAGEARDDRLLSGYRHKE
jgi:hypothetical protein